MGHQNASKAFPDGHREPFPPPQLASENAIYPERAPGLKKGPSSTPC